MAKPGLVYRCEDCIHNATGEVLSYCPDCSESALGELDSDYDRGR